MLTELARKNRSYRRYDERVRITPRQLERWIGLTRFCASGRNMQPLKYAATADAIVNEQIFGQLAWAGYLTDWKGPAAGERPAAYIAILLDRSISGQYYCDDGIAAQTILLGAVEEGYGGCILGSVNRSRVSEILELPGHLEILWVIALGKPAETVVIEELAGTDIRYWRDAEGVHHVPKRPTDELIVCMK